MAGNYKSKYSGAAIDAALTKILGLDLTTNGWLKLPSTVENPINLNDLTSPGNYTIAFYTNGAAGFSTITPINVSTSLINGTITQYVIVADYVYTRTYSNSTWTAWTSIKNSSYIYIQSTAPTTTVLNSLWIDTSDSAQYRFKVYTASGWVELNPSDMMKKSIYDPSGKNVDFFKYVDDSLKVMNETTEINTSGILKKTAPVSANWYCVCYGNGKFVAIAYNSNVTMYSTDGITWTQGGNAPVSANWYCVCYGDGKFVAVALNNNVTMYSTDGITWTQGGNAPISANWQSVCYGDGKFVAITNNSNVTMYSTDGITWTRGGNAPVSTDWRSVCYGNGKFVGVAYGSNYTMYSTDGITWTQGGNAPVSAGWNYVCYGNGKFVAISYNNNVTMYSTDGITWTQGGNAPVSAKWYSVCYGNGKFVAISSSSNVTMYSTDGITWIKFYLPDNTWRSICSNGSNLMVATSNGTSIAYIPFKNTTASERIDIHLADNISHVTQAEKDAWAAKVDTTKVTTDIATMKTEAKSYTDGKVTTLTGNVTTLSGKITTNETNLTAHKNDSVKHVTQAEKDAWNAKASPTHKHLSDGNVKIDASMIVSGKISLDRIPEGAKERMKEVASDAARFALTKADVQNGDMVYVNTGTIKKFYVVIDETKLNVEAGYTQYNSGTASSINWSNVKGVPTTLSGFGIVDAYTKTEVTTLIANALTEGKGYADTKVAAFSSSIDLLINTTTAPVSTSWYSVCYGNGKFVAISYSNNKTMYSTDGITWTQGGNAPVNTTWQSVCYGNDKFVAISYNNNVTMYSTDGITWTQGGNAPAVVQWYSVCYGNGKFVAISYTNNVTMYSTDGITWTQGGNAPVVTKWTSVCYGNGKFVAICNGLTTMYSTDGITWTQGGNAPLSASWVAVCYGNGKFVAVVDGNVTIYSTDGITWTRGGNAPISTVWISVCYGNGKFVAISTNNNVTMYSTDGITWTRGSDAPMSVNWRSVCYGNGKFVAISNNTSDILVVSYYGGSWNNLLLDHEAQIDSCTKLVNDHLLVNGVALKDVVAATSTQATKNSNDIIQLMTDTTTINTGLTEAETLSTEILALVQ